MKLAALTLGAALGLLTAPAAAQNYREMPIGGRTATMGGAGTAAGNDSAMPYLNPAGLAGVPGDIFAVSATVYSLTHRSFKKFFFPNGTPPALGFAADNEDFSTDSVGELPSSVMYFRHLNPTTDPVHHHLGVSLVIPSARNIDLVASVSGRLTAGAGTFVRATSLQLQSRAYYVGPTYAVGIGRDIRLGASFYGLYQRSVASFSDSADLRYLGGSAGATITNEIASKQETFSLAPILGAQARVVSDLWVGLGVAIPTLAITGRYRANEHTSGTTISSGDREVPTSSLSTTDLEAQRERPLRLNAGVAWQRPKSFSAALDLHVYFARKTLERTGTRQVEERQAGDLTRRYRSEAGTSEDSDPVVDVSVGGEYAITDLLAVRAGFFTDFAGTPEVTTRDADYTALRVNRVGGTLGLGLKVGSFDTTAGVLLARGSGRFGALDFTSDIAGNHVAGIDTTETTGMIVLSGAVTIEEAKKLIRDTLPIAVPLPDLELGDANRVPMPWIPEPLPPETKPAAPKLRRGPPEMIEPKPPTTPAGRP